MLGARLAMRAYMQGCPSRNKHQILPIQYEVQYHHYAKLKCAWVSDIDGVTHTIFYDLEIGDFW